MQSFRLTRSLVAFSCSLLDKGCCFFPVLVLTTKSRPLPLLQLSKQCNELNQDGHFMFIPQHCNCFLLGETNCLGLLGERTNLAFWRIRRLAFEQNIIRNVLECYNLMAKYVKIKMCKKRWEKKPTINILGNGRSIKEWWNP